MKIVVTGSFCSGKTTLVNQLCAAFPDFALLPDLCRPLLDTFPDINWSRRDVRDFLIVQQLIAEHHLDSSKPSVIDGGVVSNIAHDSALLSPSPDRRDLLADFGHRRYDIVFFCDFSGVPLVDDGQRFLDPELRRRIDMLATDALALLGYDDASVVTGSPRERLAQAEKVISRVLAG